MQASLHSKHGSLTGRQPVTDLSGGMTLVEILLVLVLLVIIGSLAAPILDSGFASVRLRRGADQILAGFMRARTEAIESGLVYQFLFRPDGNSYRIDPWRYTPDESDLAIEPPDEPTGEAIESWTLTKTLPEHVTFHAGQLAVKEETGQRTIASLPESDSPDWSRPIFFFPDGTTSEASLLLRNDRQVLQRITLRALTGVARASGLLSEEEATRARPR